MRTDRAAVAVLRDLAGMVEANMPGTLADLDTEFLHDLRVAVRRSRSVLRELKGAFAARARWPASATRSSGSRPSPATPATSTSSCSTGTTCWPASPPTATPALRPVAHLLARHRAAALRKLKARAAGPRLPRRLGVATGRSSTAS